MKKELKNKILNDLNNYKYYEIRYDDEITNDEKITINKTQYNIYTFTCSDCGNETKYITAKTRLELTDALLSDDVYEINYGGLICNDCFNDHWTRCDECGDFINCDTDYNYVTLNDGRVFCENCADNYAFYCEHCDTYYDNREHENYDTAYNTTICDDCYYDNYATCEHCGGIYDRDEMIYVDDCGAYYCDNCYDDLFFDYNNVNTDTNEIIGNINDVSNTNAVRGYHDAPREFIKRVATGENENDNLIYYGVELETSAETYETQKNASCYIAKNLNCIIENDSSVCGYPMEIISDPQTIKKWDDRREKITHIFNDMIGANITSHNNNTCGLHVHVSRAGLGETTDEQTRVINNIILIIENFKNNMIKLSRRDSDQLNRWGQFISNYNGDDLRDIEKIKKCDKHGRYLALNLNNYKTIEFRFFRGTLNVDTFYATLHLVNNIIELAKRENIRGVSFKQLIHLNNYADLIEYAKQRNCDNNVVIIDRGNKTKRLENKTRRDNLKRYVKTNVLKNNIFSDLLNYADIIDNAILYIDRTNATREIENMLNIPRDAKKELIYKNYNELLNIFKYHLQVFNYNKMYEYLNKDDMKKARELYNELIAIIKVV